MQPIIMSSNATKDDIAPDDAEWGMHSEIRQLSGKILAETLLSSIIELDIEQQTMVLAKIRELKAKRV